MKARQGKKKERIFSDQKGGLSEPVKVLGRWNMEYGVPVS